NCLCLMNVRSYALILSEPVKTNRFRPLRALLIFTNVSVSSDRRSVHRPSLCDLHDAERGPDAEAVGHRRAFEELVLRSQDAARELRVRAVVDGYRVIFRALRSGTQSGSDHLCAGRGCAVFDQADADGRA